MKFRSRALVMGALFLALVIPSTLSAQERVSLKISPTLIENNIEPGTTQEFVVHVQNLGTEEVKLYPLARDITGIDANQRPVYATPNAQGEFGLGSWISYTESFLLVEPSETKDLHFTIKFPADAPPGSHMAGVFLSEQPTKEIKLGSSIGFEVGAILNFRVAGEVVEDTRIREFFTTKMIYGTPIVPFTLRLENLGNTFARPRGIIDITNMFGRKVTSLPVNEEEFGVFPKTTREFAAQWNSDELQIGRFEAVVALSIEGPNGSQTISRVLQFWVLPMNILMPTLGGLLFLILFVYVFLRLYVRRQLAGVRTVRNLPRGASGLSRFAAVIIGLLVAVIIGLFILFFYFG
jgi:hypothetical protein